MTKSAYVNGENVNLKVVAVQGAMSLIFVVETQEENVVFQVM